MPELFSRDATYKAYSDSFPANSVDEFIVRIDLFCQANRGSEVIDGIAEEVGRKQAESLSKQSR